MNIVLCLQIIRYVNSLCDSLWNGLKVRYMHGILYFTCGYVMLASQNCNTMTNYIIYKLSFINYLY